MTIRFFVQIYIILFMIIYFLLFVSSIYCRAGILILSVWVFLLRKNPKKFKKTLKNPEKTPFI